MAATPDYQNKFLSKTAKRLQPSPIRGLLPLESRPNTISFLAGKPNPSTFPFESLSLTLTSPSSHNQDISKQPPPEVLTLEGTELQTALQYSATAGTPELRGWLMGLIKNCHLNGSGKENLSEMERWWTLSLGNGSGDLIAKAFIALLDEGDSVLVETPAYAGTLGNLRRQNCNLIEVATDDDGLIPSSLRSILVDFNKTNPGRRFPKFIYTCPTGCNPTGCSSPESRKREILEIAREFDLLILEDDAYFFLLYDTSKRAASYLSLEASTSSSSSGDGKPAIGRVIRFDSFSKVLSSGMRLGYVTGPKEIVEKIDLETANTNLQPSTLTQTIAYRLLNHWGYDGFDAHCQRVAAYYKSQCEMFERIARKELDGLASWVSPVAGMFLYFRLHGIEDTFDVIRTKAVEKGVLAVPGTSFLPLEGKSSYVRTSFSLATPEQAEEAFKRLREVILEVQSGK